MSEKSQKQYQSAMNALQGRGFDTSFKGMCSFVMSEDDDCLKVANSTIDCYVSALKHFFVYKTTRTTNGNPRKGP